jgi:hypothetical protein
MKEELIQEAYKIRNAGTRFEAMKKPSKKQESAYKELTEAAEKAAKELQTKRGAFLKEIENA